MGMAVRESTTAPSSPPKDWARTRRYIGIVFAVGLFLFSYGFAAIVLRILPIGWGIFAAMQFVAMAIGALLISLTALLTVWLWRQDRPQPLGHRQVLTIVLIAPIIAFGGLVVTDWLRVGGLAPPRFQFFDWTFLGLAVLSLQFFIGSMEPAHQRRLILVAEAVIVFVFLFGFLTVVRQGVENLASYVFVSGGGAILLLLFGSPLYLFGSRLSELSR